MAVGILAPPTTATRDTGAEIGALTAAASENDFGLPTIAY